MALDTSPTTTPEKYGSRSFSWLDGLQSWLVTLLVPIILVLTSIRLLLTPAFISYEYKTPNFPPDTYGFTKSDRLYWSQYALNYLLNQEGISYLGDLRFEDGTSVYNQRELKHMLDVKAVLKRAMLVWYLSLGGMFLLGIYAWRGGWLCSYYRGLSRGGFITSALIFVIIIFVLSAFGVFFVGFHQVFFETGTWIFNYSDTLIRLFPERFWRDVFIYVGIISLGSGLLLGFGLRSKK
jgi:integral membrane protein (TIGR01906 family)